MKRDEYPIHPLAELFPRIGGAEFDALCDDIKANGLRSPIVLYENQVIDGRHRLIACSDIGIKPIFTTYKGDDPAGFVVSANIHRRHMTPGQQSQVTALALQWSECSRGISGKLAGKSQPIDSIEDGKPAERGRPRTFSEGTQEEIANAAGVSERGLRDAIKVANADPELAKEVAAGEVTLPEAVEKVTGKRPGKRSKTALEDEVASLRSQLSERVEWGEKMSDDNRALIAENESMGKIIDSDDRLKTAAAEIKRLQMTIIKLEARIVSLQNEKNAAIRAAKSAQRKAK